MTFNFCGIVASWQPLVAGETYRSLLGKNINSFPCSVCGPSAIIVPVTKARICQWLIGCRVCETLWESSCKWNNSHGPPAAPRLFVVFVGNGWKRLEAAATGRRNKKTSQQPSFIKVSVNFIVFHKPPLDQHMCKKKVVTSRPCCVCVGKDLKDFGWMLR